MSLDLSNLHLLAEYSSNPPDPDSARSRKRSASEAMCDTQVDDDSSDNEGRAPQKKLDKGKGKAIYLPELPEEVWRRIFEIHYDGIEDAWHERGFLHHALVPLLLSKSLFAIALPVLYSHPHLTYPTITTFIEVLKYPCPHTDITKKSFVKHLTVKASPQVPALELEDIGGRIGGEYRPYTVNTLLGRLLINFPRLHSFTLKDTLILHAADASALFDALKLIAPKKARLEFRMWDLTDSPIREDLLTASRPPLRSSTRRSAPRPIRIPPVPPATPGARSQDPIRTSHQEAWRDALWSGHDLDVPSWWFEVSPSGTTADDNNGQAGQAGQANQPLPAAPPITVSFPGWGPISAAGTSSNRILTDDQFDAVRAQLGRRTWGSSSTPNIATAPPADQPSASSSSIGGPPASNSASHIPNTSTISIQTPSRQALFTVEPPFVDVSDEDDTSGEESSPEEPPPQQWLSPSDDLRSATLLQSMMDEGDFSIPVYRQNPSDSQSSPEQSIGPYDYIARARRLRGQHAPTPHGGPGPGPGGPGYGAGNGGGPGDGPGPNGPGNPPSSANNPRSPRRPSVPVDGARATMTPGATSYLLAPAIRAHITELIQSYWCSNLYALSLVAFDPLASMILRSARLDFWTEIPVSHIRVHLPRSINPLAVFKGAKESARDRARNRAIRMGQEQPVNTEPMIGGDGCGGGLLHENTKLFEIEVNTAAEMADEVWMSCGDQLPPQVCRILAGEHDWREVAMEPNPYSPTYRAYGDEASAASSQENVDSPNISFASFDSDAEDDDEEDAEESGNDGEEGDTYDSAAAELQAKRLAERKKNKMTQ